MKLAYTRAMVSAALAGDLDGVATETDPVFGLHVPSEVPGVPTEVLNPRGTWTEGEEYDAAAQKLASMFKENFEPFETFVPEGVKEAGPK